MKIKYEGSVTNIEDLTSAIDGGVQSQAFTHLVSWLAHEIAQLNDLEETVHPAESGDDAAASFMLELSSFLKEMNCPLSNLTEGSVSQRLASSQQRTQLIDYLCSELMAARMLTLQSSSGACEQNGQVAVDARPQITESTSAAALRVICQSLGFPKPPEGITEEQLIGKLIPRLKEQVDKLPPGYLGRPLFTGHLSDSQWQKLQEINATMKNEYRMRAEMLLKRLDVTIQSFAWSDRVKKMEDQLIQIYRPLRSELHAESHINLSDLLAARDDIKHVEKTSSANVRKRTQSKINKVQMKGRVPDRGGRPTEIQPPPPEMPPWQKDRTPMGTGGGRGGGRGGGGRGGGGGWQQNPGQHGHAGWGGDNRQQQQHQPQRQQYGSGGGGGGAGLNFGGGYQQQQQFQAQYQPMGYTQSQSYGGGGYQQQHASYNQGYQQQQQHQQGGYQQQQQYHSGGGGRGGRGRGGRGRDRW